MPEQPKTDVEKELADLRREIVEARNLVIKSDNLLKNLHAEVKAVGKRHEDLQKRQWLSSAVAYVLFAMEHPAHFRVMFGPHFTRPPQPGPPGGDTDAFGLLMDSITEGQRIGAVREGEPRMLALTCWSLVHRLGSLLVDRKLEFSGVTTVPQAEALAQEQTRLLMRGLGRATGN